MKKLCYNICEQRKNDMFEINFFDLGSVDEALYTRVVVVSRYNGKWIYCKHKERDTWEIPGGHIEAGENWYAAAKRELYEETGATELDIEPICVYSITKYGLLCYADIKKLDKLPESEIEKIEFFDDEPQNLTYPGTHTKLFEKVKEIKRL